MTYFMFYMQLLYKIDIFLLIFVICQDHQMCLYIHMFVGKFQLHSETHKIEYLRLHIFKKRYTHPKSK